MTENLGRLIVVAKEKERLESELAIARDVQNQLFPKDVPFTRSLELKGVCSPARMVSGDYYDFMALPENGLAFAIGDVAGKGISAALLMATIQSTMRTQLSTAQRQPAGAPLGGEDGGDCSIASSTPPPRPKNTPRSTSPSTTTRRTRSPTPTPDTWRPCCCAATTCKCWIPRAPWWARFPSRVYEEKTVALEQGDVLVAYTDGIVEPENVYGEMFGEERLKDLLVKYAERGFRRDSSRAPWKPWSSGPARANCRTI